MTTQTEAQRLAAKMKSYKLASGYAWHCHKAGDELLRLDKIEAEWAALSQDEGKSQRQIDRLEAANAELVEALEDISDGFRILKDSDFPALAKARAAIKKHGGAT